MSYVPVCMPACKQFLSNSFCMHFWAMLHMLLWSPQPLVLSIRLLPLRCCQECWLCTWLLEMLWPDEWQDVLRKWGQTVECSPGFLIAIICEEKSSLFCFVCQSSFSSFCSTSYDSIKPSFGLSLQYWEQGKSSWTWMQELEHPQGVASALGSKPSISRENLGAQVLPVRLLGYWAASPTSLQPCWRKHGHLSWTAEPLASGHCNCCWGTSSPSCPRKPGAWGLSSHRAGDGGKMILAGCDAGVVASPSSSAMPVLWKDLGFIWQLVFS